jgi:hypothetical protein
VRGGFEPEWPQEAEAALEYGLREKWIWRSIGGYVEARSVVVRKCSGFVMSTEQSIAVSIPRYILYSTMGFSGICICWSAALLPMRCRLRY